MEVPKEIIEMPEYLKHLKDIPVDTIVQGVPSELEIANAIRKLKNGKSSADIPAELLKYAISSPEAMKELKMIFEEIWKEKKVPPHFGNSRMTAIFKNKGKITDPKMYRMIQTSKITTKLLSMIILQRISPWIENQLLQYQLGFRQGSGTAEGILAVRTLQRITRNTNQKIWVLLTDMTAGFDTVIRQFCFQSIYHRLPKGANLTNFQILESLYNHTEGFLTNTKDTIQLKRGTRQGGVESPSLWALFLDWILRIFIHQAQEEGIQFLELEYRIPPQATTRQMEGRRASKMTLPMMMYADDLQVFLNDQQSLEKAANLIHHLLTRYHLILNLGKGKTATMILSGNQMKVYPSTIVTIKDIPIENVQKFILLGSTIYQNASKSIDLAIR